MASKKKTKSAKHDAREAIKDLRADVKKLAKAVSENLVRKPRKGPAATEAPATSAPAPSAGKKTKAASKKPTKKATKKSGKKA